MNKNTFVAAFSAGSLLDISGIVNPLGSISGYDVFQLFWSLLGLLISGFVAAVGAWLWTIFKRKYIDKR